MFTKMPSSGPDTGHVLVVPFSRSLPAHPFWDPRNPSCRKELAPVRRKLWQAVYPILSRTPSSPTAHLGPPVSSTEYCSQGAPILHLTEVLQTDQIPQPEVVGAANRPASLGGTCPHADTSADKANGTASYLCAFLPAFLIFLLCLENNSLLIPVLPPLFCVSEKRVRGPCGRLGGCGFSVRKVNTGQCE